MKKVYACLIGEWVCLNDDPTCTIGDYGKSPYDWWEEHARIYSPVSPDTELEHSLYGQNYVNIYFNGNKYRINPIFIQIMNG